MKANRFIKTALVFLAGNMLSKLVSFFLLPLYTSKIDPTQFGNYDVAMSFINLIVPIAFFQIWDGMYRYAFEFQDNLGKQKVISNSAFICFLSVVLYLILITLLQLFFEFNYFYLVVIYGVLYAFHYLHTYSARLYLSNTLFVVSGVASTLITAVSNIILILAFKWDIKSIYVSAIIGQLAQILIIECKIKVLRSLSLKSIDKGLIKKMLKFSIPLCIATVSYWLLSGLSRIFIQNYDGDFANGLYAVANKFGSLITLLVAVVQFAWNETAYIFATDDYENRVKKYSVSINVMTVVVIYGTALICLAIKLVFPWFIGAQYSKALLLIPATIIGVSANALAGFFGTIFMAEKKNGFIMVSTFISAFVNIVLGYFASKSFGVQGALVALAISFTLLFIMRAVKLKISYKFKFDILNVIIATLLLIASTVIFFMVENFVTIILTFVIIGALMTVSCYKYISLLFNKKEKPNEND